MEHTGRTILGYYLKKRLGKGTFGSVYLGERLQMNGQAPVQEQVAIKIFTDESDYAAIKHEAESMARLSGHPNIVRVLPVSHDSQGKANYVGRDELGNLYLLLEYAAHGS